MYKVNKTPKQLSRRIFRKTRAVSPVVATLILIVVAIIGAISVGLIMSNISTSTAGTANQNLAKAGNNQASTQILLGGSTTLFPLDEAAIPTFTNTYHINVVDSQGGSDAGMQGVISGALDIGAASSVNAVHNAFTDVANNQIVGVQVNYKLIGGSGVVVGTTSTATGTAFSGGNAVLPGFISDGTNSCIVITRDALAKMYDLGQFYVATGACGGTASGTGSVLGVLTAACVLPTLNAGTAATVCATLATTTTTAAYQTVSRSDPGGTEDAFGAYVTGDQGITYVGGSGQLGASSNTGSGNAGVLSVTQACKFTDKITPANNVAGCVGFFDLGFAEGAVTGATCQTGWTASTPCGVSIPELSSPADSTTAKTADTINAPSTTAQNQFIPGITGGACPATVDGIAVASCTTSGLHAFIKSALKSEANVNPVTLTGATSVYPDTTAPTNSLARTFYYVTNGAPTATENQWISFMTSYNAEPYFTAQGFFSQYDFTAA